jgi:hypothetical protein
MMEEPGKPSMGSAIYAMLFVGEGMSVGELWAGCAGKKEL